jgi:dipeptidyl aminopeptidase/acylaminoacyl peptidase
VQIESTTSGTITAHLTLPAGVQAPVPAVIIPRSLPTHEDIADPHYLVQFLAASGYAVLRVQNRVDEAYGRGWLEDRAIIGWNQSADDINDAAGFLVENGISEPGKVCTAGKDYGAYVSFMSAIKYPDVFSCTISIAGVADPRETPGAPIITATASSAEDNRLNAASPIRRASELNTPVLMFHGEADADFSITEHSVTLATVLERSDKDVTFIQYPHANHQIKRGPYRVDMLARIGGFLAEHIGPASAD